MSLPSYTFSFAVRILSVDTSPASSRIGVGFADSSEPSPELRWFYLNSGGLESRDEAEPVGEYGAPFAAGDEVVASISILSTVCSVRYWLNGVLQGVAFRSKELAILAGHPGTTPSVSGKDDDFLPLLAPAVVLGGASRVVAIPTPALELDATVCDSSRTAMITGDGTGVWSVQKWSTVLAAHPGIRPPRVLASAPSAAANSNAAGGGAAAAASAGDAPAPNLSKIGFGGVYVFSVFAEGPTGGGLAVGLVDAYTFDRRRNNLGTSDASWCLSKTGQKGHGGSFVDYAPSILVGSLVTAVFDADALTLSFAVNGVDRGVAFTATDGLTADRVYVPAVCLGSTGGGKVSRASVVYGDVRSVRVSRFLRPSFATAMGPGFLLAESRSAIESNEKWRTLLVDAAIVRGRRFSFGVLIESAAAGAGAAIGFVDADKFDCERQNLGAANSWCFSKTGKYCPGTGVFEDFTQPFRAGDVITAEVDGCVDGVLVADSDPPQVVAGTAAGAAGAATATTASTATGTCLNVLRFYVNGKCAGERKVDGIGSKSLLPAVALGTAAGGPMVRLRIVAPAVTRWNVCHTHRFMSFMDANKTAFTDKSWCTVLADHPGARDGDLVPVRFAVKIDGTGSAAVGIAVANFRPLEANLGVSRGSWILSKTGTIACGDNAAAGYQPFCSKLNAGDVIGVEVDLTTSASNENGRIRFWKNGQCMGTAYTNLRGRNLNLVPAVCLGTADGGKRSSATLVDWQDAWLSSSVAPAAAGAGVPAAAAAPGAARPAAAASAPARVSTGAPAAAAAPAPAPVPAPAPPQAPAPAPAAPMRSAAPWDYYGVCLYIVYVCANVFSLSLCLSFYFFELCICLLDNVVTGNWKGLLLCCTQKLMLLKLKLKKLSTKNKHHPFFF
jgi:hypothetical protein